MSRRTLVLLLSAFAIALPSFSHAGLGDLMKKAKEKAQQAVAPKESPAATAEAAGGQPVFDEVTLELTPARLDQILAALEKAAAEGAPRPALVEKLNQVQDERNKHMDKNEAAIREARDKRDEVETCTQAGYREAQDRRAQEYAQRAMSNDPALREKHAKAAAQYNAAAAKGDSTAIAKLNEILQSDILPTAQDSADVRKKCGTKPAVTPAETKLEELDQQIASLNEQIRAVDDRVAKAQSKQGGLTQQQWGMAMERIQMYLAAQGGKGGGGSGGGKGGGRKGKSGSDSGSSSSSSSSSSGSAGSAANKAVKGYSKVEVGALEERLAKLRQYVG